DAAWQFVSPFPVLDIPKHAVKVDGKADDWADAGLHVLSLTSSKGRMRGAADFDPSFRVAWTDAGLAVLVQVKDNAVAECPDAGRLWEGDSVELFMTPRLGSGEVFQLVISPGADGKQTKPRYRFYDTRRATRSGGALKAQVAGAKTPDGYIVEALLPWRNLKIKAAQGGEVGVQLFVNDKDPGQKGKPFRVQWHAGGHPVSDRNPKAFHRLRLAAKPSAAVGYKRAAKPGKAGLFAAVAPHPYPFVVPPLGAHGEDAKYTAQWTSAVKADRDALVIEAAIPWKTLAAAGMGKTNLMIDVVSRGPLGRAPALGGSYQRVILVSADKMKPRTFTVRLHFAELDDVRRGERVFDVRLQGKTVLEDFDVVRAARGRNRAVVKEFDGVVARRAIMLEFIPKAAEVTERTAPILSAIEILPSGE
ncbi:hypothetical protein HQ576_18815, partial [bacterium]|nr:hypothetical protein [bacterium]